MIDRSVGVMIIELHLHVVMHGVIVGSTGDAVGRRREADGAAGEDRVAALECGGAAAMRRNATGGSLLALRTDYLLALAPPSKKIVIRRLSKD